MANDRFRARFAKRIEKSNGKIEQFVKKLVVDIDKTLSERSPVDTGRFKANWIVGNGTYSTSTTDNLSSEPFGEYDNQNAFVINEIKVNGQTIYITNSLPYAKRLETGHSKTQARFGMVGLTLAEVNSKANKIGVQLRSL